MTILELVYIRSFQCRLELVMVAIKDKTMETQSQWKFVFIGLKNIPKAKKQCVVKILRGSSKNGKQKICYWSYDILKRRKYERKKHI